MLKRNLKAGEKIGLLTTVSDFEKKMNTGRTRVFWNCVCECGNDCVIIENALTRKRFTKSCGCYQRKGASERLKKYNIYDLSDTDNCFGITDCGYKFYFDLEDYDKIRDFCWHRHKDGYLRTCLGTHPNGKNNYILMHSLIIGLNKKDEYECDHINRKPNDNRKCNLRKITHRENMQNQNIRSSNKSGAIGVYFCKSSKKWKAYITHNSKKISLGTFENKEDAVTSRKNAEKVYHPYREQVIDEK